MEAYFTSPTLGKIYGTVKKEDCETYRFTGQTVLLSIVLCRSRSGWVCKKEQWLHDSQIKEIGLQIDKMKEWVSAK